MKEWKDGRMEGWKDGRMERWKDGRMEGWNVEALAEIPLRREKNGRMNQFDNLIIRHWKNVTINKNSNTIQ